MNKKYILIILSLSLVLMLTACNNDKGGSGNNFGDPSTDTKNEEIVDKEENTEQEEIILEPVSDKIVSLFDEDMSLFTPENLPSSAKKQDFDGDGLKNDEEISLKTDMYLLDTDNDGLSDYDEVKKTNTDPLKWSSRDDNISDLEWSLINLTEFKEGYSSLDASGYLVYKAKAEDRLFIISKKSVNTFDDLETISEAYQIKNFSGKMALDCSAYTEDVANNIAIYKDVNGKPEKIETFVNESRFVEFEVSENDIFVAVYQEKSE